MMRFWFNSYLVRTTLIGAAIVSVVLHAALIAGWVLGTLPTPDVQAGSIANHVFYIPPPDRAPTVVGSGKVLHYIHDPQVGSGTGDGPRMMGEARPTTIDDTRGDTAKDSLTAAPLPESVGEDSVYSVLDVDTAVVRSANSAAPAYPLSLLQQHIMGYVNARYVVDTTGFADTTSFIVLKATNPEFVTAVRDALPYMRFAPAKIGPTKVRQLVEQQFSFRISDGDTTTPPKRKP